jgi:hypothetical protein
VRQLRSHVAIHVKGALFLALALMSAGILFLLERAAVTALCIVTLAWASARWYYYVFYVIERWIDPSFRYTGVISFVRYALRSRSRRSGRIERP